MYTVNWRNLFGLVLGFLLSPILLLGQVRMPAIFADHMVLQQQTKIKIWGWADPFETATVKLSWIEKPFEIKGDGNAEWSILVDTPAADGKKHEISVKGPQDSYTIRNIVFGEVWICAGQSNMEWAAHHGSKDALEELPRANQPNIRLFKMHKAGSATPQENVIGKWEVCDSTSLRRFSAIGYFFGKQLNAKLGVPIGLIDMAWGGSQIESWIPEELVHLYPLTRKSVELVGPAPIRPHEAGRIYNGMVYPIKDYKMAGVLWYQGESNAHYPEAYLQLQEQLITYWRQVAGKDFPFYYVQIAPFEYGEPSGIAAARVREMQTKALYLNNTGMVVTLDVVDNLKDIHPTFKKPVGDRLAQWALQETYQQKGDWYKSAQLQQVINQGSKLIVTLQDVSPKGLVVRPAATTAFEVAGADGKFVPAQVKVTKANQLEVWATAVKEPRYVRYAFSNAPVPTLFDQSGLPVMPFRSDSF